MTRSYSIILVGQFYKMATDYPLQFIEAKTDYSVFMEN
jgi:hypothetical protein